MTGYPNEDEGPDEVNWQEPQMSEEKTEHAPLLPCPFCWKPLYIKRGKINPAAYCRTDDCFGNKFSAVALDDPRDVAAWNTRTAVPDLVKALEEAKDYIEPDTDMPRADRVLALIDAALAKVKP